MSHSVIRAFILPGTAAAMRAADRAEAKATVATQQADRAEGYANAAASTLAGAMTKLVYDPTNINASPFDRANHTGTQPVATVTGAMDKAVYDPSNINASPFARANHTGTQAVGTITGLGNSATRNVGTTAGTVAAGDDSRLLSVERTIRDYAAGRPIGFGNAPLSAHYATLAAAQVDFPAATSLANQIAGLAAQKAADDGIYQWGEGVFYVNTNPIIIKPSQFRQLNSLSPIGLGSGRTTILTSGVNAPLFEIRADTTTIGNGMFGGFTHYSVGLAAGAYLNTATINFVPSTGHYIWFNKFDDIHSYGVRHQFIFNGATHVTSFGNEGNTAWNQFSHISALGYGVGIDLRAVLLVNSGSSTNNTFNGLTAGLGPSGSVCEVNNNNVFGDITFNDLHIDGGANSVILRINNNPAYLNNIRLAGQADGGIFSIISAPNALATGGNTKWTQIDTSDLFLGGGVTWYTTETPFIVGSNLRGEGATSQHFGVQKTFTSGFGSRAVQVFWVEVQAGGTARIRLTVAGTVGGLASGVGEWDYAFNGATVAVMGTPFRSSASASFFNVTTSIVSSTTLVLTLTFTDSSNSEFDAHLAVTAGRCRVHDKP